MRAVSKRATDLAKLAQANPFAFLSFEEVAELFNFGKDVMTALAKMPGFPVVAKKVNPTILMGWLKDNAEKVGSIRN